MQIGLIGAGRWGKCYIKTLTGMPGIKLVYLASRNVESVSLVSSDCKVTPHWQDLLNSDILDCIIIATPPQTHLEMALGSIHAGIPVLVEKPMTLSLQEARNLVKESMDCGVLTMVGHTHLYSTAFRELKIKGRSLGRLRKIRSAGGSWGPFRIDTPPLWDWAPHDIAMSLDLLESFPLHIEAKRIGWKHQPYGTGEAISITLNFDSEVCAEIQISNIEQHKQRVFEAIYENGILIYDDLAENKLVFKFSSEAKPEPIMINQSLPLSNLVTEFCRAVSESRRSDPSLQLGLQVVEVLTECQTQLKTAR